METRIEMHTGQPARSAVVKRLRLFIDFPVSELWRLLKHTNNVALEQAVRGRWSLEMA